MDIQKHIEELREEIAKHQFNYYTLDEPEISDTEYDTLIRELRALEQQYPEYDRPDSPSKMVGGLVRSEFPKTRHSIKMYSLKDVMNHKEYTAWTTEIQNKLGFNVRLYCEPKYDGRALEVIYANGKLIKAITRGDGEIGEEVTLNAKTIRNLPHTLKGANIPEYLEVRGEVYMPLSGLQAINANLESENKKPYKNARNAVGIFRNINPAETAKAPLRFVTYGFGLWDPIPASRSQSELIAILEHWGLPTSDLGAVADNFVDVWEYYESILAKRSFLDYEIDGVVVKIDSVDIQEDLGFTTRVPYWACAIKFPPEEVVTTVETIDIQIGRTGQLTPVAKVKPAHCAGVTISSITLFTQNQIDRLNLNVGDEVVIYRSGDVIPYIDRVIKKNSKGTYKIPLKSKEYGQAVFKGDILYCADMNKCKKNVIVEYLKYYCSKALHNIEGMGPKVIANLVTSDRVSSPADLYTLNEEDLISASGSKVIGAKLLKAINKSKKQNLSKFIQGLGIRHVGESTSEVLANRLKLESLMDASIEDLLALQEPKIGPETAKSIYEFFHTEDGTNRVMDLIGAGVQITKKEKIEGILTDRVFLFTGSLKKMNRRAAAEIVKTLGGEVSTSLTKRVTDLVYGDKAGSKLDKAKKNKSIKIMDESQFMDLVSL